MIRLMEVLLHGGTTVGGWRARDIHRAILTTFRIGEDRYGLNQLRYDLRKMKAHGLLQRDGSRYAYRLSDKGTKSLYCSCSSTNNSADRWPTVSFITAPPRLPAPKANSKPPSIKLMTRSLTSSTYWKLLEMLKYFCLRIER